jgi:phage shock protein A
MPVLDSNGNGPKSNKVEAPILNVAWVKRFGRLLRAKSEELFSGAEDPEDHLAAAVTELDEQVHTLHRSVARAVADEKRLKMQAEDHLARSGEWESRAVLALKDGDEDLAREALVRKRESDREAVTLQKRCAVQEAETTKLKSALQTARQRVGELKREHAVLVARYDSAQTQRKLQRSLLQDGEDSLMPLMRDLQERIDQLEAETQAELEISGESVSADLEARFVELERRDNGDEALAALKAKLARQNSVAP